ncbi:AbrB/MazE/SpoVT family DNA-binding domain-containing protein [Natrinema sp. DC36]|uniref:AbrB/MazE/SpoVT family DNA-binding domain-containing protein n=1 Tax=Natrinema sp. DC36 TaxID=2878680 RepID=UPI001CF0AC26|nr:AbrB/MazE/SpoVT family DNA-binding domain-containing protein [Natrinema sp. DC36]
MDGTEDAAGEEYGTIRLDCRGRVTIPTELRDEPDLEKRAEFRVIRDGGDIHLIRELPDLETVTRGSKWGDEAFRDAGDATFGE